MRKAVHFLPVMMLAGCATMSADNCAVGDWSAVGYGDAARGEPFLAFSARPDSCAKVAAADVDAYIAGVANGLSAYCQPARGFAAGASGETYYGVCTGPEGETFETAYGMGKRLFALRQARLGAEHTLADARAELWKVRQRETVIAMALQSPSTPRPDRVEYRAELKSLAADRVRLEAKIASMSQGYVEAEQAIADYRLPASESVPQGGVLRPIQASY